MSDIQESCCMDRDQASDVRRRGFDTFKQEMGR